MKIILFGSTGMLGNYVYNYLSKYHNIICINRNELDISTISNNKLENIFLKYKLEENDIIINCIGIIPQSKNLNNANIRNYFLINSIFPNLLSFYANLYKLKFIHITTDCVFSGSKGNYNENDLHDEMNEYGVSKSLGEMCYNATIIRTSIIGEETKNKYSLLEWVKKHNNNTINGYTNHFWNGVTCLQLAKIINQIINNNIWWKGVRHIFSPNTVSKYELVNIINDVYKLNNTVVKFKTNNNVDKTLCTNYETNNLFNIPNLIDQICELKNCK